MVKYKKGLIVLCFVAIYLVSTGMGEFITTLNENFPIPAKNFTAVIVDQSGVKTEVSLFSINGFTFLYGTRGKGTYSIPFEKLQSITFRRTNEKLEATARLTTGKVITIMSEPGQDCYGRTEFGTYSIKLGDVQQILITGRIQQSKK
ncbi:MAG: hypothetical protein V3V52_09155 [Candidatus Adiutricales bacterium]